jgi:hypothetical protein
MPHRLQRHMQMPVMRGVERPAEQADAKFVAVAEPWN